jgi:uncharacterized protein (DUF983 family)
VVSVATVGLKKVYLGLRHRATVPPLYQLAAAAPMFCRIRICPQAKLPMTESHTPSAPQSDERPLWPALLRGWRQRCPNCGAGPMMRAYLKVRDTCPVCGQDLHHHRADDGPAYLTILIVGHLMAPILLFLFTHWEPDPLTTATVLSVGCVGLSLYLLPRLKGALVAVQWSKRMHGFGHERSGPALTSHDPA